MPYKEISGDSLMLRLLILFAALFALPCAGAEYYPTIYPLRDGLIPGFDVAGDVQIVNAEPSKESVVVYKYGFIKLQSSYHHITQTMVDQIKRELEKNGKKVPGGSAKKIEIKVTSLVSKYIFFHWKSSLSMQATLGDGTVVYTDVTHGSGDVTQDLNGCIAEGVMVFLKDEQLRSYLSKTDEVPVAPQTNTL
jgi:hypothetical protein